MNFHAKSGGCSSKNGRVIALGTKEDISGSRGGSAVEAEEHIIISGLYSPNFLVRSSQSYLYPAVLICLQQYLFDSNSNILIPAVPFDTVNAIWRPKDAYSRSSRV